MTSDDEETTNKRKAVDPVPAAAVAAATEDAQQQQPPQTNTTNTPTGDGSGHKKSKKLKRKHRLKKDPAMFEFRKTVQLSCRDNDLGRALKAFREAKEKGMQIEAPVYYSMLALCDGLKEEPLHIGAPRPTPRPKQDVKDTEGGQPGDSEPQAKAQSKHDHAPTTEPQVVKEEISLEERKRLAFEIKAEMDKEKIPLTDAAYTSVIKLLSKAGDLEQAHAILLEAEKVQQCKVKLRLYSSLLQAYAESGRILDALGIWDRVVEQDMMVSEKEYLALLRGAVKCQNAILMEAILTDVAEDVPVPSVETTKTIVEWFESPAAVSNDNAKSDVDEAEMTRLLEKIHKPKENAIRTMSPSMGPVQSSTGWTISPECSVDTTNGSLTSGCLTGESLQQIGIAAETWEDMAKANETIVMRGQLPQHQSPFQGGKKGPKNKQEDNIVERQKHWKVFLKYLEERKEPIEVVVDGANVGYFDQNYLRAPKHVSYVQIDWVIDTLKAQGKSVLLVMHSRHFAQKLLPPKFKPIVDKWKADGVLYRTPPGMNDDWFWMHIALLRPGTLMVTNDQLRDHHFQLMGPRSFLRWRERHQVFFDFGEPGDRKVRFTYPDPYSRRVQRVSDGLVVPHPKRGDENRFLDGCFVAKEGVPETESYLCIRPKR